MGTFSPNLHNMLLYHEFHANEIVPRFRIEVCEKVSSTETLGISFYQDIAFKVYIPHCIQSI